MKQVSGKPYAWYLTELSKQEDELLDLKEDVIDPIGKFIKGSQREIFDRAYSCLKEQEANFAYIEGNEVEQIRTILQDPQCFKGGVMQQVKTLLETLQQKVSAQIEREIQQALHKLDELKNGLVNHSDYGALSSEQQAKAIQPLTSLTEQLKTQNTIAVIRDTLRSFEKNDYIKLLAQIHSWTRKDPDIDPEVEYVSIQYVLDNLDKTILSEPSDVDSYLKKLGEVLRREIENGKRISI